MSTDTKTDESIEREQFDLPLADPKPPEESLDPKLKGKASRGVSAKRKAQLAKARASLAVLDAAGVDIPHRSFNPEDAHDYPTTVAFDDGTRVHLHQDVREDMDDDFGSFGSVEMEDDVIWTVVDLLDETVTLTVVGDWSNRREVPFEDFPEDYEPIYVEWTDEEAGEARREPRWGY